MTYKQLKTKFLEVYAKIPRGLKREICAVQNQKPYTFYDVLCLIRDKKEAQALPLLESLYALDILK